MWGKNASPLKIRRFNSCFFEYQKGVDPLEINDFEGIKVYLSRDSRQTIAGQLPFQQLSQVYLSRDSRQTIAQRDEQEQQRTVYLSRDSRQTIAPDQRAV